MSITSTVYKHSTWPRKALLAVFVHVYTKPCSAKLQACAEQKVLKGLKHVLLALQNIYLIIQSAVTKTQKAKVIIPSPGQENPCTATGLHLFRCFP